MLIHIAMSSQMEHFKLAAMVGAFQVGCNGWSISSWLQWLAAQSVRIFTFGAYKLLMKQIMMSLSIGYLKGFFQDICLSSTIYSQGIRQKK